MGEHDRLSRADIEAGSIQGDEMNEQLANIKVLAANMITNRDMQIARLERENAELRAALETLLYRATELPQYATHDGLMNSEAIAQARAILERTMK